MQLPFTVDQFFDVFGDYNLTLWPVLAAFWVASVAAAVQLIGGRVMTTGLAALAAIQWAWTAVIYHALYFTEINPAAWLFAGLFLVQAGAFFWFGVVRRRLTFKLTRDSQHTLAALFLIFALLYPALAVIGAHQFPRAPLFGVPCPLTLFTAGLLLAARPPVPPALFVLPIVWCVIGGSAALLFGVIPDLALWAAAVVLTIFGITHSRGREQSLLRAAPGAAE